VIGFGDLVIGFGDLSCVWCVRTYLLSVQFCCLFFLLPLLPNLSFADPAYQLRCRVLHPTKRYLCVLCVCADPRLCACLFVVVLLFVAGMTGKKGKKKSRRRAQRSLLPKDPLKNR
jgi:hypothetical protein